MAERTEALVLQMSADIRKLERSLARAAQVTNQQLGTVEKRFDKMNSNVLKSGTNMAKSLGPLIAGLGLVGATRQTLEFAEAWTEASNKLTAAGVSVGQLANVQERLVRLSLATRTGLTETVDLFARLTRGTAQLGATQEQVYRATTILNQAFKAGGATASEQRSAILQLGQALSSGVLQGDELRSLRENAPLLAKAIADEFGVTVGQLKELGAEGKLTTDRIFNGILKAGKQVEEQFKSTRLTVGEAFTNLATATTAWIGRLDEAYGITKQITDGLMRAAGVLDSTSGKRPLAQNVPAFLGKTGRAKVDFERTSEAVNAILEQKDAVRELSQEERKLAEQRKKETLDRLNGLRAELSALGPEGRGVLKKEESVLGHTVLTTDILRIQRELDKVKPELEEIAQLRSELTDLWVKAFQADASMFLDPESTKTLDETKSKLKGFQTDAEAFKAAVEEIAKSSEGSSAKSRAAVQAMLDYASAIDDVNTAMLLLPSIDDMLLGQDRTLLFSELEKLKEKLVDIVDLNDVVNRGGNPKLPDLEDELASFAGYDSRGRRISNEMAEYQERFRESVKRGLKDGIISGDWQDVLRSTLADALIDGFDRAIDRFVDVLFALFNGSASEWKAVADAGFSLVSGGRPPAYGMSAASVNTAGASLRSQSIGNTIDMSLTVQGSIDAATWPQVQQELAARDVRMLSVMPGVVNATLSDNRKQKRRI